jgi:hypothetical protein
VAVERRLDQITGALTPQEAVLVLMDELHAHGSMQTYAVSLKGQPEEMLPLTRLLDQVEQTARTSVTEKKPSDRLGRAVRVAVRDAHFLYTLMIAVNAHYLEQQRVFWLLTLLASERAYGLMHQRALRPERIGRRLAVVQEAALEVYRFTGAVTLVAERSFGGRSPLFPEQAADLARLEHQMERLIALHNDAVEWLRFEQEGATVARKRAAPAQGRTAPTADVLPPLLDGATLRAAAQPAARGLARSLEDRARADTLIYLGEHEQAVGIIQPYLAANA